MLAWRPALHAPADAMRTGLSRLGAWGLIGTPLVAVVELMSRLFVGWWRLTAPAVNFLNRNWLLWPPAIPMFLVGHLFLGLLAGTTLGQWMPGIIGSPVGPSIEAYIAVQLGAMVLVGIPTNRPRADVEETMTGWQSRVLLSVLNIPETALSNDLKSLREGDRPKTRASRPKRIGDSTQVVVTLPVGMDAERVAATRTGSVAGSLNLPENRVVLSTDRGRSARDLVVRVLDIALEDREMGYMPVPDVDSTFFQGFTVGLDRYGDPVHTRLFEHSALILGASGSGKSWVSRTYGAAAALDPLVDLHIFAMKQTADFDPLEPVALTLRTGGNTADTRLLESMSPHTDRRGRVLREHGAEKLTPQLAANPELDLRPIVVIVDECHVGFQDEEHGEAIGKAAADIAKRARYVGIVLILASQEGNGTDIPRPVTANMTVGLALRVLNYGQVDNALGTGAYKNGADATKIPTKEEGGAGVAYIRGVRPTIEKIKTYGTNLEDLGIFASHAAEERAAWDAQHGRAELHQQDAADVVDDGAGELIEAPADLLDHVVKVIQDRPIVARKEVLAGLQSISPERYGTWTTADLSKSLKGYGIERQTGKAPGAPGTQAILSLDAVNAAIEAR
jgi:hypothetical protein